MQIDHNTDDAWNLFNLISVGDLVFGKVRRKVAKETLTGLV
jgi:stalled ribosome rescue protein Dom34